jgi:hypothetical protein
LSTIIEIFTTLPCGIAFRIAPLKVDCFTGTRPALCAVREYVADPKVLITQFDIWNNPAVLASVVMYAPEDASFALNEHPDILAADWVSM